MWHLIYGNAKKVSLKIIITLCIVSFAFAVLFSFIKVVVAHIIWRLCLSYVIWGIFKIARGMATKSLGEEFRPDMYDKAPKTVDAMMLQRLKYTEDQTKTRQLSSMFGPGVTDTVSKDKTFSESRFRSELNCFHDRAPYENAHDLQVKNGSFEQ